MIGTTQLTIPRLISRLNNDIVRRSLTSRISFINFSHNFHVHRVENNRSQIIQLNPNISHWSFQRYKSTTTTSRNNPQPETPTRDVKTNTLRKDISKLFRLAKPEVKIIIAALLCLILTSAVSMSLPLFIGKIIDTAKTPDSKKADADSEKSDNVDDIKIFGLEPYEFYGALGVFFSIGAVANFGRTYLLRSAGERLVARLRSRLFLKILSQDSYFFEGGPSNKGMKTGDLISRLSNDTQIISKTLSGNVSDGARSLISGCVGLSMMCFVLWKLTLCMSAIFPPLIIMSVVYGRRIKQLSRTIQENLGDMTKVTEEKLNGLKTIQSFAQQRMIVHDYNQEIKNIFRSSMREGKLSGIYYGINGFLGNMTLIGLLVIGTKLIGNGEITVGDLSSFMMYAVYTGSSVFGLGNFYSELMKGVGAAERVFELIELKPKITTTLGKKVDDLHGDIEFRNVKFSYPSRPDSPIFGGSKLNLTITKGEHVCFVGPSGSGKSSISQLLLRFYDPTEGTITVNKHNIKDLNLNFYRSQVGYVQQEPLLFSGTIRDNIVFGRTNSNEDEIREASMLSNAYKFIDEFPDKFDTVIGPTTSGAAQLSGGQKQRVSLARTLIKKPDILILDEATSALDSQLEEMVMKNLKRLSKDMHVTIILIAHRLSTIRNSERIIVVNYRGEIVEDGKFNELYNNSNSELNKLLKAHELQ
ncbi:unnamed protein product [Debaryomyces fabryi]|nr:unnamed protein product [Debaryomyces fabryi]